LNSTYIEFYLVLFSVHARSETDVLKSIDWKWENKQNQKIPGSLPWGPFLTSPLAPRGEICTLGVKFTTSFIPRGEHSECLEEWGENRESHPQGITSSLGDKFTPWGQLRPWGRSLPLRVKLRMGLSPARPTLKKVNKKHRLQATLEAAAPTTAMQAPPTAMPAAAAATTRICRRRWRTATKRRSRRAIHARAGSRRTRRWRRSTPSRAECWGSRRFVSQHTFFDCVFVLQGSTIFSWKNLKTKNGMMILICKMAIIKVKMHPSLIALCIWN
jgi:hypothetical protein